MNSILWKIVQPTVILFARLTKNDKLECYFMGRLCKKCEESLDRGIADVKAGRVLTAPQERSKHSANVATDWGDFTKYLDGDK
jgi:hypothetical protein